MAESSLSLGRPELLRHVGRFLAFDRDPDNWTADELADVEDIVSAGLRAFYTAHDWKFLRPEATLVTTAPYSTGTIAVTSGVVTLTGGTWPSWAQTDGELRVNSTPYAIASRDSDTQLTLTDTSLTVASGSTYSLARPTYQLPDNFAGLEGYLTWQVGAGSYDPPRSVGEAMLRRLRSQPTGTGRPLHYAVRCKSSDGTTGQRWEIEFCPTPNAEYRFDYCYFVNAEALTAAAPYPLGGMTHAETIRLACLAAAEETLDDAGPGPKLQLYVAALATSIRRDTEMHTPDSLGVGGDPLTDAENLRAGRGASRRRGCRNGEVDVTYEGDAY